MGFNVKASFVCRPLSRLIKPGDVKKNKFKRPLVLPDFSGIENFKLNERSMVKIEGVGHHFE